MVFIGIFFVIYYFLLTSIMGSVVFSVYLLYLGIILLLLHFINKKYKHNNKYIKFIRKIKPFIIILLVFFAVVESLIAGYSFVKNNKEADYLIILGAGLRGETMTMTLRNRMEDSCYYLKEYDNCKYIVLSGGQGPGESIPEAEAMERYLLSMGIEKDRIIKECESKSTYENLQFSKVLIEEHSGKNIDNISVKLSTSGFHSLRTYILAKKCGYSDVTSYGCSIHPIFIPTYYTREFLALMKAVFDIILI